MAVPTDSSTSRPTANTPKPTGTFGSGDLYSQALSNLKKRDESTPASSGPATLAQTFNSSVGDSVVTMPNAQWYYSSADAYSQNDPNSPYTGAWNYGMDKTSAAAAYGDDYFVSPGMRAWLDAVAYSIHPLKKGEGLWTDATAASALSAQRGEFKTPYQIIQDLYGGSQIDLSGGGSGSPGYTSGGGGGYSGGGSGGGGGQVSLTNPASARGLLMQTMQSVLGRDPTGNEVKTFLATLNETEMANPQTVSVEGDTVVGKGGTDPGLLAMEFAQDATDYKERQGDMYYQTFMRALAGGV